MQYEYEMFFDDTSPVSIHGWWPIATDRIKDQSKIQEYIDKGILRRIDMKEQDAAHSFEKEDDDIRGHHEKRTAEELLAHTLNVKVETILLNPDATITNSEAIEFAKVFTAQELDAYKARLKEEINKIKTNSESVVKYAALSQIIELIDKL